MNNQNFTGKVAFVTGAANGIGRATALAFARDGAHVVVADISEQGNQETARMIEDLGGRAIAVKCDVSEPQSVTTMANEVRKQFGRADIVVNCTGIYPQTNFTDMTYDDWRKVMSVNLDSAFLRDRIWRERRRFHVQAERTSRAWPGASGGA